MKTKRLKIGLALGSGSARGWAHIGVIKALTQLGVPIDCVAGCSIGSLVGAIYACGTLDAFEQWVLKLDRKKMSKLIDLNFTGGGLISGSKLMNFFKEFGLEKKIEELRIPFCAVATDLNTGREVWLNKGSLVPAIRSSISLPGLFTPLGHEDHWLVDGGLVNPVPISLCRAMGAELVIAVNLNHELLRSVHSPMEQSGMLSIFSLRFDKLLQRIFGYSEGPGYYDVLTKSIKIMQDRITRARAVGDPADLTLIPQLPQIALHDFHRAEEAINEGEACVLREKTNILQLVGLD
ncbi:patatin-like phospholipase RssA [Legionella bononiensis]|uniref:Patatin-like phospholipase RssA n=1 Tax=Legionella bononiensis TaxID=2793102 RepID=A0ABS1W8K4_9GAMM|nr:patatin-like phospholipase RssA [Legionella bononiensis]MBL7479799.1 patatin-like phospholipase RssA [Legionella bononiensis]MBL7525686.1 patatin-like phospholipase RssA [Legionella bononiensis]MBL7561869.1 patatin-like phospholipase RssA [Legionella bononiensis]